MTILRLQKPIENLLIMSSDDIFKKSHKAKNYPKKHQLVVWPPHLKNIFKQKITPQLQGEKNHRTHFKHNKPTTSTNCIFKCLVFQRDEIPKIDPSGCLVSCHVRPVPLIWNAQNHRKQTSPPEWIPAECKVTKAPFASVIQELPKISCCMK